MKFFWLIVIAVVISLIQVVILPLNSFWVNLNLILILICSVFLLFGTYPALIVTCVSGLILDYYSSNFMGSHIIILLVCFLLVKLLYQNLFTDFSFYSALILTFLATITYRVCWWLLLIINNFWSQYKFTEPLKLLFNVSFLYTIILNLMGMTIFYVSVVFITKRFNTVFLRK